MRFILSFACFCFALTAWCDFGFGEEPKGLPKDIFCDGSDQACRLKMKTLLQESEAIWNKRNLKNYHCRYEAVGQVYDSRPSDLKFVNLTIENGKITRFQKFDQKNRPLKKTARESIFDYQTIDQLYRICQDQYFKEFEPLNEYMGYLDFDADGILRVCGLANQSDLSMKYECSLSK